MRTKLSSTIPYNSVSHLGVHGPLRVYGDLLKESTRPVEMVHDLLLAVLDSTEVQQYCSTAVTRCFFSIVISNDHTFKKGMDVKNQ